MNLLLNILNEIWLVTVAMAPYLLFGFAMAGVLSVLISRDYVRRHLGGQGLMGSVKAALVGVPMRRVIRIVQDQRDARYSLLRGYFHGADDDNVQRLGHDDSLRLVLMD